MFSYTERVMGDGKSQPQILYVDVQLPLEMRDAWRAAIATFLSPGDVGFSRSYVEAEYRQWSSDDNELARDLLEMATHGARKIIAYLSVRPDQVVPQEELAEAAGLPASGPALTGTLSWPSRYARRQGRHHPVQRRKDGYMMKGETAMLFRSVLVEIVEEPELEVTP